jgi:uncharacterized protein YdaU (DUF1376 family)
MKERSGMPYDVVAYETDDLAMLLNETEEGIFHRMLRRAWMNGSVPADLTALAQICRTHPARLKKAWRQLQALWVPHPSLEGRLINLKQERERTYLLEKRDVNRKAAIEGWSQRKSRTLRENTPNAPPAHPGHAHGTPMGAPWSTFVDINRGTSMEVCNQLEIKEDADANAMRTQCERIAPYPLPIPTTDTDSNIEKLLFDSSLADGRKNEPSARPRDLAMDCFCEHCERFTGTPYVIEKGDGVQLAKLRKAYHTPNLQKPPDWDAAVGNYFASPLAQYSLADLANPKRYAVFHNSALDGYKVPVNHNNAKGRNNGRQPGESAEQAKDRRNREAAQQLKNRLNPEASHALRIGDASSTNGNLAGILRQAPATGLENSSGPDDPGMGESGDAVPGIHPAADTKRS